jgi:mannose-6-phosphate isomerase-like protein (cupin superfamily)
MSSIPSSTVVNTASFPKIHSNEEIYVRRKENCFEIDTGYGEKIYELIGVNNGKAKTHSVALVEIAKGASSQAHYHPASEESYLILEGKARLVIEGETQSLTPGALAKIPMGKVHQIFNDQSEALKLFCFCAPAWTPECYQIKPPGENQENIQQLSQTIYSRNKEDCNKITIDKSVSIYELLGKKNGDSEKHSVAGIEIERNGCSQAHYHPECEESYLIQEGQGRMEINGETRVVKAGDAIYIPTGKIHQIFNESTETLKLYSVCSPAWTPDCGVYLTSTK